MTIHDCTLNGVSLSSLDKRICVLDVQEDAPEIALVPHALPRGGQRLHLTRQSLTVRIKFAIHEANPTRRKAVLQAVCAWAMKGGTLTLSDRPGKQLCVDCTSCPAVAAEDWTAPMTLVFTTTHCPWWEDAAPTSVSGSSSMTLALSGTADFSPVDVTVTNGGDAAVTLLSIRCGDSYMIFSGVELPVGGTLAVRHEAGVLSAAIGGESVLAHRTAGSDDLLLAPCGKSCTVSVTGGSGLTATFSARGRYA